MLESIGISVAKGGMVFSLLEFGVARFLPVVMGPIGWAASAIIGLITLGKNSDKSEEILNKILQEITPKILLELNSTTERIKLFTNNSIMALENILIRADEKIEAIKTSLNSHDEQKKKLLELEQKREKLEELYKGLKG